MGHYRGGQNNYAGRGRRVYATPNNESEHATPEWESRPRTVKMLAQNEEASSVRTDAGNSLWNEGQLLDIDGDAEESGIRRFSEQASHNRQAIIGSQRSQFQEGLAQTDLRSAATLLLESASEILFEGLCESCSASIKDRLKSIATGAAKFSYVNANQLHNEDERVSCDEIVDKRDTDLGSIAMKHHSSKSVIGATADLNILTSTNIIRSDFKSILDAPAYRTRSLSRLAALPETPEKSSIGPEKTDVDRQRILNVTRKKDFCFFDRVNGRPVNILEGLELHINVLNKEEQQDLIDHVYELQELGRSQKLRRRTYSEPRKWMRGKGRVTIQFGCCYNYAVDKDGNPPGIIRDEEVDEIPPKLRMIIKRLVEWQVLPPSCIPDSCIVNIYDVGDCIPPHIDHHDFVRPFCTLSLLSECDIIFGTNLKIAGPGDFIGSFSLPLPVGSVLILNGNGADVAKHAVPAVPTQRISITFRKMDPLKVPASFKEDKELLSTRPPLLIADHPKSSSFDFSSNVVLDNSSIQIPNSDGAQFSLESDFPALARPLPSKRQTPHIKPRNSRV